MLLSIGTRSTAGIFFNRFVHSFTASKNRFAFVSKQPAAVLPVHRKRRLQFCKLGSDLHRASTNLYSRQLFNTTQTLGFLQSFIPPLQ